MNSTTTLGAFLICVGVAGLAVTLLSAEPPPDLGDIALLTPFTAAAGGATGAPLLATTTSRDVRQVVVFCREARAKDEPRLRRMALESEDPLVAGNAIRALGRLGVLAGDPKLVRLIRDPRLRVRQETVRALGESKSRTAVGALEDVLAQDDAMLRPLAIQALGNIGGPRSRAVLEKVRDNPRSSEVDQVFARATLKTLK